MNTETEDWQYEKLLARVSPERRSKAARFRFRKDAVRTAAGELLLQRLIRANDGSLVYRYSERGKPELISHPGFHHNISHAGCYVVCVCSDEPVGADVEELRPVDDGLAENCFTKVELAYLGEATDPSDRLSRFYELWTGKESYIKLTGEGLSRPLHSFAVRVGDDQAWLESVDGIRLPAALMLRKLDAEHALAICAPRLPDKLPVSVMTLEQLLQD
ncbi:4'-phosphopantetheinyl transferase family protein [Paenibacillus daejeonensis]|uniref:4'-phosphopantetheinyl transferase family protein n=1 Tax=Paenibacillus daejeonensis TaxID=135193 RepID=UPI00146F3269|nr:4'-phosphopantetheinyl transferase superfamily protein [Paenibacillus daejeonensis]